MMSPLSQTVNLEASIPEAFDGMRLDQALANLFPEYSRSRLQAWIRAHQVLVNGKYLRIKDKVKSGDAIVIAAEIISDEKWLAQSIDLNILFEDESIIIINKPPGLIIHPGAGMQEGTLLNALLHHEPKLSQVPRAGIIHRLDKDTSGILVIAKTLPAHHFLIKQMQERKIVREYRAIVNGVMTGGGTIETCIGRHPVYRTKMAVVSSGKEAITHYRVLERYRAHTYVKVNLQTGRTHQIRVHMAYIHYPLVGDHVYGGRLRLPKNASTNLFEQLSQFKRQALHALKLELTHPISQQKMSFDAPLPEDMENLLKALRDDLENN